MTAPALPYSRHRTTDAHSAMANSSDATILTKPPATQAPCLSIVPESIPRYRVYGRQQTQPLTNRERELFEQLLPNIDIATPDLITAPAAVLEIGFGHGEHLLQLARQSPQTLHMGCETFTNGVANALCAIDDAELRNVKIHHGDIRPLYNELPPHCFDRIFLLFPDPWPKKRHWKRRFVQSTTFAEIHNLLKPGGVWCIATDDPLYQKWISQHIQQQTLFRPLLCDSPEPWEGWFPTRYQQKALAPLLSAADVIIPHQSQRRAKSPYYTGDCL